MTATIVNAAPMTIMLGVQDLSTRALVPEAEVLPTHLPKVYIYAKKGPITPKLVSGVSMTNMYGVDSFDLRLPWANHATVLTNSINATGNALMVQRVVPADAGEPASIRISLDVMPTQIPEYHRNADGSISVDLSGQPIATGVMIAGFRVKWVSSQVTFGADGVSTYGIAEQTPGDQVVGTAQSVRYPIMDLLVPDPGAYGNNNGLRMWAPTSQSGIRINDALLTTERVYPFRMACVTRPDVNTTPSTIETQAAEQFVNICLKPNVIDSVTDSLVYAGDVFIDAYQNLTSQTIPSHYGPFGHMRIYDANVSALLALFYAAETPYFDSFSDFTGVTDEHYRFNLLSGTSSSAVPYHSFQLVSGTSNSIRFTENSTVYATGGADGTMSDLAFAGLVATAVSEYANENSILQDTARYPESIIYDSGFPLATKYAMCSFIAVRKDTALVLSTYSVTDPVLTASQESSLAIALRTRLQMYPESEFYGTPTMRGMIVGRCGKLLNSQYRGQLPLTVEIATKAAAYMGSGNGKWKAGFSFDHAPASEVDMFSNVNVSFTPATVRNKDWSNGLNWVESFSVRRLYFPALKTVYDNDTSVLNSFFTMMACVELEKVGDRARRQFSGVSSLTNAQLVEQVNQFVIDNTIDRFDKRFVIKPNTYFTAADIARGYSWTLVIKLFAAGLKTVMSLTIQSYRIEDLPAQ